MTQPCHKDTALNQQCCDSKHKGRRGTIQYKRDKNNARGEDPIQRQGITAHTTPRHSIGPQGKRQGETSTHGQGADIRRGVSNTAALPSSCHPPSMTAPPSITTRGERTEDTPPHEHHRHTPTPTPRHSTWQVTVHDMTAVLASTAVG